MTRYGYTARDLLETREHYFYSALQGPDFLTAYRAARAGILADLPEASTAPPATDDSADYPDPNATEIDTDALLDAFEARTDPVWLELLIQRYEVGKRLFDGYGPRLRGPRGDSSDLTRYARFAAILADEVTRTDDLRYLNTLLKLNDLICSQSSERRHAVADRLRRSLTAELAALNRLGPRMEDIDA